MALDRPVKAYTVLDTESLCKESHKRWIKEKRRNERKGHHAGVQILHLKWTFHVQLLCHNLLYNTFSFPTYIMTEEKNDSLTSPLLLTLPPSLPRHCKGRVNFNLAIPGNAIKR